jgi:Protein of unknown function (DUF2637)
MSDYPVTRGSRSGDPHPTLRLAALAAVIAGVLLVAVAAFLLSYEGIHQIALQAGVSPTLARLYPLMFDAMLIIACAATLALRSAGWGSKCYVWACLLLVLAAVAVGDALHATGVRLDGQPARAAIAIIPWVLLLMGFGLWLVMLRHWRRIRAAGAANGTESATGTGTASRAGAVTGAVASRTGQADTSSAAATRDTAVAGSAAAVAGGAVTWAASRGATPARTGAPRSGIDELMKPRAGQAPERAPAAETPAAGKPATGREQPSITAPDRSSQPTAAGTAGKAGSAAAGTRTGTAQNGATTGTATGPATTGPATTGPATTGAGAAGTGPSAAVVAGAAGAAAAGAAASRAADSARTGKDGNGKDNGQESNGKDNGGKDKTETRDRRTRLGGLREVPVSAVDDEEGSVRILPVQPKAPAQGAASAKDSKAGEAGTPEGDADHAAETPSPLPAAALAPQFDRLRSSPTPPEDTGADER